MRIACAARALENQCYVVQAPTVGAAPWSIAVDENVGAAGVFAPADRDLPALELVRRDGQVLGHRDWDRGDHTAGAVAHATLAP